MGLEINIMKCKIMIFGTKKQIKNNLVTFNLYKEEIQYTDVLKYLGLEFTFNMDMDNFFIEKFKSVPSFHSILLVLNQGKLTHIY